MDFNVEYTCEFNGVEYVILQRLDDSHTLLVAPLDEYRNGNYPLNVKVIPMVDYKAKIKD